MSKLDRKLLTFLFEREIHEIIWDELDLEEEVVILGFLVAEEDRMRRRGFGLLHPDRKEISDLEEKQKEIVQKAIRHKTPSELKSIKQSISYRAAQSRKPVAVAVNDSFYFGSNTNNNNNGNINVRNIKWSNNSKPTKRTKRRIRNVTRRLRRPKYPLHK